MGSSDGDITLSRHYHDGCREGRLGKDYFRLEHCPDPAINPCAGRFVCLGSNFWAPDSDREVCLGLWVLSVDRESLIYGDLSHIPHSESIGCLWYCEGFQLAQ